MEFFHTSDLLISMQRTRTLVRSSDRTVRVRVPLKVIEIFLEHFQSVITRFIFFAVCRAFITSPETFCFSLLSLSFIKELKMTELNTEPERSGSLHA